jgi:hypothetical protein
MNRNQLSLGMRGKLGWHKTVFGQRALQVVAVGLTLGRRFDVNQARTPSGNLYALLAKLGRPGGDRIEGVERRPIPGELCQKDRRTLDGLHDLHCLPRGSLFCHADSL